MFVLALWDNLRYAAKILDNQKKWMDIIKAWSGFSNPPKLVLSHQTNEVISGMMNFGGFTDGDRALCFAIWAGVKVENIELLGFSTKKIGTTPAPWCNLNSPHFDTKTKGKRTIVCR